MEPNTSDRPTVFVPLALRQEHAEALLSAATVVYQSALVAKQTDTPEFAQIKEAIELLGNALDKAKMEAALKHGGGVGQVMLDRIQRDLRMEREMLDG